MCLCSFSWAFVLYTMKPTRHMPSKKTIRGTSVFFFTYFTSYYRPYTLITKYYSIEIKKWNKIFVKNKIFFGVILHFSELHPLEFYRFCGTQEVTQLHKFPYLLRTFPDKSLDRSKVQSILKHLPASFP